MIIKIHNFFTVAFIVLLLIYVLLIAKVSYLGVYIHYTALLLIPLCLLISWITRPRPPKK
uniref:Uncharacterized protein n=1 Tax=uncultured prokaryote TaxID=198431 RepID=A0A0H5PW34_9ZZZZ|nr:hypothetical protein [uncultured prokaryote]